MAGFYENITVSEAVPNAAADAVAAKDAAEAAQALAESAKQGAEAAKSLAEQHKNTASGFASTVSSAQSIADANVAATSADKTAAEAARNAALGYKNDAVTAKNSAESAANSVSANAATVAGKTTEIDAIHGSLSSINTVSSDLTGSNNIGAVAAIPTQVETVAGIATEVVAVHGDATDIGTVAGDLTGSNNIGAVAGLAPKINTVAGLSSELTSVHGNNADITTVATSLNAGNIIANVSSNIGNVNDVGNKLTEIEAVNNALSDIEAVADDLNGSDTIGAAVASASAASTSASNASSSASSASTSATNASNSATAASNSATAASASKDAASGSASAASGSASAAASSASEASTSASNADTSETNAASSASAAATSASNAATSASSAASSATTATTIANDLGNLDNAITNAAGSATSAATSASTALGYRNEAETHKNNAYTYSQSAASAVTYQDLTAIAQSKSVTATDVFVYDTSKDSDGGAWRHRTQGTSWYNETLNTSTRGATKKFPAVAVIVVKNDEILIYDGDDPSLPLWMKFDDNVAGASSTWWGTGYGGVNGSCVTMKDGLLCAGTTDTTNSHEVSGLSTVSFISEKHSKHGGLSGYKYRPIAERATAFQVDTSHHAAMIVVHKSINDVAMTVLPNAPIDADTGLPVPTIAVATDGGVSVIKDDGSVVDITYNSAGWGKTAHVAFGKDNQILFCTNNTTASSLVLSETPIPTADVSFYEWEVDQGAYERPILGRINTSVAVPNFVGGDWITNFAAYDGEITTGAGKGLTKVENGSDNRTNLFNYITSDYNTGWMNGDIKLATLSDTDTTNVTGSELVSNTGLSDWVNTTSATWSNGALTLTGNAMTAQSFATVAGKTYVWLVDVTAGSAADFRVGTSINSQSIYDHPVSVSSGSYVITFTATSSLTYITLKTHYTPGSTSTTTFDNISVRLAEPDRSVNGNGLQVHGTVTKTAVATGADLVSFEGASGVYLEQPYNADLNFGYGDYCVMFWGKQISGDLTAVFRGDANAGATGGAGGMHIWLNGSQLKTIIDGASQQIVTPKGNGSFAHYVVTRRNGTVYFYQDGVLFHTYDATTRNVSRTEGTKVLSGYYPHNNTVNKLALLRISATAPTAEQIAKMYRDEKPLFQENAKATLYGTSDAVKALAYDDDTELLHAGTSAGRSVFKGLQRVSNTTDAVGVAISASNDLVVEE